MIIVPNSESSTPSTKESVRSEQCNGFELAIGIKGNPRNTHGRTWPVKTLKAFSAGGKRKRGPRKERRGNNSSVSQGYVAPRSCGIRLLIMFFLCSNVQLCACVSDVGIESIVLR